MTVAKFFHKIAKVSMMRLINNLIQPLSMKKRLGNGVKSERKQLGLSQTELARLCGVDHSIISKIESNQYIPSISVAFCFEFLFQKPLGDIFPQLVESSKEHVFEGIVSITHQLEQDTSREWTRQQLEDRASYLANHALYEEE